jgi:hypothetical protein
MLLCLHVQFSHAQSKTERASVEWGKEMSDGKDGAFTEVVGYTDDHVYMTVEVKKETFLRKMDHKFRTVYQKLLPLTFDKNEHTLKEVVVFGDQILVFTTFLDKKAKTTSVYLRRYNEADMKPQGRIQRLATIDVESRRNTGASDVRISPNKQAVLIGQLLPFDKEGREKFDLKVYDKDMNPLWEQSVELPYLDKEFTVEDLRVMDDGTVLMIGMKYAEKREAKELKKDGKVT